MIGLVMVFTVIFNCIMLGAEDRREMRKSSKTLFWQMEQILSQNQEELEVVQREFAKNCLRKAKTAAYIIQEDPTILKDLKEMQKIASYLKVDEIHIFDKTGRLYTGTEPKYYDYTFQSGEQMKFFLPMLKDQSLQLCQEIMPNTAEHKMMQYAAVWQENRKNIIQIGMEPSRVLELTKKNELSYIFSQLMPEKGAVLYAMDYQTGEVLGSTEEGHVGKNLSDLGLKKNKVLDATEGFQAEVNGEKCFCIFTKINSCWWAGCIRQSCCTRTFLKTPFFW